jgi:hypothetical protein
MSDSGGTTLLREQLQKWTAAGLIDADQAGRIEAAEQARAHFQPRRRVPLVAEALGYLGSVLAATAIGVALHQVWRHVPPAAWLAFAAMLGVGLLAAGALVKTGDEPAFARLRSVLWLLATASAAGFTVILTGKYLHLADSSVALSAEAAWLACAIPLWWLTRSAVQQAATFGGAIALAETGLDKIDPHAGAFGYGLTLWALAVVWGVAAARGYVVPRITGLLLSGAGALTGALIAMISDNAPGQVLGVLTVAGLLAAGVAARRVLLIGIGAAGTLYVIPAVAARYLPGSLAAPLAVAMVGLVMFGIAIWLARHRRSAGS